MTDRIEHRAALPVGYGLHEYRLTGVLGHGGFGITYSANDAGLGKAVAIKEYLPGEFAVRDGVVEVAPKSSDDAEPFHWGLERFLEEARILARFHHPNVVGVHRYFEANGTAYMVMEFIEGDTLAQSFRNGMTFDAAALKALALPLLDGLEAVHQAGYLHRDIKPSNIMLRPDGRPVLLDFGSARSAMNRGTRAVTSLVTPGYAPYEQYYNDGNQGPWTDIYALGAILHQIVAGKPPVEAPARLKNDPLPSARALGAGRYPEPMLAAIDWAMAFDETKRPQSVADWRRALAGDLKLPQPLIAIRQERIAGDDAKPKRRHGLMIAASIAALLVASGTAFGVLEYRALQQEAAREVAAREQAQREVEHAAEIQAAALAREIEAREDAERLRKANEEAAEKARLAEEKAKAEEKRKAAEAARVAAEKERQAEQARRIRDSEELTRKALADAEARREAEERSREQARIEDEQRARDDRLRRGPDRDRDGRVFGRTVTRDQIGRPRILTGPINPQAQPPADLDQDYDQDRPRRRGRDSDRFVQNNQQQYDAEAERRRAEERARAEAERDQLQRDLELRRQRQQDDLRLLEEQRLRDRR